MSTTAAPNSEDDAKVLLVLILDLNPFMWARAAADPDRPAVHFSQVMEHMLIFINAHLSLRFDNKLAIIACHPTKSEFIYSTEPNGVGLGFSQDKKKPANVNKQFMEVDDVIAAKVRELGQMLQASSGIGEDSESTMISASLSKALAYINRLRKAEESSNISARIMILSVSSDSSHEYISIMNSIFAAKKFSVPIDVCRVYGSDTVFLSQAAYSTGGVFEEIRDSTNLIAHLVNRPLGRFFVCQGLTNLTSELLVSATGK